MDPSTLVVGMDLEFKPQMYLQNGKPAGYDVVLLNMLAKQLGVKLKIENLAFDGLIPGLQAKKFDMVSVGLSRQAGAGEGDQLQPGVRAVRADPRSDEGRHNARHDRGVEQLRQDDHVARRARRRSSSCRRRSRTRARSRSRSRTRRSSRCRPGRADGIVVENYLLAQFNKSNGNKLKQVAFTKPLHVEYGS